MRSTQEEKGDDTISLAPHKVDRYLPVPARGAVHWLSARFCLSQYLFFLGYLSSMILSCPIAMAQSVFIFLFSKLSCRKQRSSLGHARGVVLFMQ
jgi:ABC-type multidrug transport system permease subunit